MTLSPPLHGKTLDYRWLVDRIFNGTDCFFSFFLAFTEMLRIFMAKFIMVWHHLILVRFVWKVPQHRHSKDWRLAKRALYTISSVAETIVLRVNAKCQDCCSQADERVCDRGARLSLRSIRSESNNGAFASLLFVSLCADPFQWNREFVHFVIRVIAFRGCPL